MNKRQLLEYINLFREKAEKSKLVIFVGSGVSCNVEGMPSWYTLIQKMAQAIDYSKCSSCRHKGECTEKCLLIEDYSADEFLKIPQYVFNKKPKLYKQVLKENIKDVTIDAPLSSTIFDINPVHIITTVEVISYMIPGSERHFYVSDSLKSRLFSDELFLLYIYNKYDELALKLKVADCNLLDKYFYQSIIYGYREVFYNYSKVTFSELSLDNQVAFLHNTAALNALQNLTFNSDKVRHFIENIALIKERGMFSSYLDIYNGNSKKQLNMKISLEKLKLNVSQKGTINIGKPTCSEIYKIKNESISQYYFYFFNHIFFAGFSDASNFFKTFIEAILCANTEQAEKPTTDIWFGSSFSNSKYLITNVDFDIITKFIDTEDLYNLINTYMIIQLRTEEDNILFLCHCFENLCYSITTAKTYGFQQSSLKTLLNLAQMLRLVNLTDKCKLIIKNSLGMLLSDQSFTKLFFSTNSYKFRLSVKILADLCELMTFTPDIEIIENIISIDDFYSYAINVNLYFLRKIILSFLKKELVVDKQDEIEAIIEKESVFNKKIILLRLLYRSIINKELKNKYIAFLSENFSKLNTQALFDFVFSDWIKPTNEEINLFFNGIINDYRQQTKGVRSIPDPVETKLECAYIMHIEGIMLDISVLNELAEGRPHLHFLISPNEFDYTQVDFSNYMWENFARHDKYMKLFVQHKASIIPGIKAKLRDNCASEAEKKILYGFLLNDKEIWDVDAMNVSV